MSDWQPIETAPRDGSNILVYLPTWGRIYIGSWNEVITMTFGKVTNESLFWHYQGGPMHLSFSERPQPSHWLPLPSPPGMGEVVYLTPKADATPPVI